jgi:predicted HTH transcriptional regulator
MFFRIDYIEQMGTGIRRMRNATREAHVAEPEFEFTGFFRVTFKRNEAGSSIGRQSAVNRPQSAAMADRKHTITSYLEKYGQAKVVDLVSVIGLSEGRVRDILREMVDDGIIEKISDKRYAHYVLLSHDQRRNDVQ